MHRHAARFAALISGAALLALAGCATTSPTTFYILSSMPSAAGQSPATARDKLSLGIGPVALPGYLDRPQVVSLASANRLQLAEFHKWAEPLQDNFSRVLAENLSILLATDHVAIMPQRRATPIDYQITFEVNRFDADSDNTVSLVARWNIFGKDGKKLLVMRKSSITEASTSANDKEAVVAAMSSALGDLSREIAMALKGLGIK